MIVAFITIAAASALCFVMYNSKKTIVHVLKEIKYEMHIQGIGCAAMIEDRMMSKKNQLESIPSQKGRIAVVTGGSRGIGVEIVKALFNTDMTVVIGVRNPEVARKIMMKNGLSDNIAVYELDVSSLKSVKKFSDQINEKYPEIDLLVNNAGIMFVPFKLTEDGYESQFATNYLGHFYLTHLLLPNLERAGQNRSTCARVVNVSSCAHHAGEIFFDDVNMNLDYISTAAYAQSKLAQIMFAKYLNGHLESRNSNVKCYSVHPGVVNTDLFKDTYIAKYAPWMQSLFFRTPQQGSIPILHACLSPRLENTGGLYITSCRRGILSGYSKDVDKQKRLFDMTCNMIKIKKFGVLEA